jgi:hypothetical protein
MKSLPIIFLFLFIFGTAYCQIDPERSLYITKAEKYRKMKTTGTVLTVGGAILTIAGIVTLSNVETTTNMNGQVQTVSGNPGAGVLEFLLGIGAVGAGVPLWIVGAHAEAKYNRNLEKLSVRLNVNPKNTGLKLTYRF